MCAVLGPRIWPPGNTPYFKNSTKVPLSQHIKIKNMFSETFFFSSWQFSTRFTPQIDNAMSFRNPSSKVQNQFFSDLQVQNKVVWCPSATRRHACADTSTLDKWHKTQSSSDACPRCLKFNRECCIDAALHGADRIFWRELVYKNRGWNLWKDPRWKYPP